GYGGGRGGAGRPAHGPGIPEGAQFTGRSGEPWQNPEGRTCRWREVTWPGANGNPAYKWVSRCHR
ncbi:MAG TPA: hypothetical protein VFE13_09315, partial [Caulobacteraceae bacterium]|nr:hypothetical protein [Caulobacteraceae bacterium]